MKKVIYAILLFIPDIVASQIIDSVYVDTLGIHIYKFQPLDYDTTLENKGCNKYENSDFAIVTSYSWSFSNNEFCSEATEFIGNITGEYYYFDSLCIVQHWNDSIDSIWISSFEYITLEFAESNQQYFHSLIMVHVGFGTIAIYSKCEVSKKINLIEYINVLLNGYRIQLHLI